MKKTKTLYGVHVPDESSPIGKILLDIRGILDLERENILREERKIKRLNNLFIIFSGIAIFCFIMAAVVY